MNSVPRITKCFIRFRTPVALLVGLIVPVVSLPAQSLTPTRLVIFHADQAPSTEGEVLKHLTAYSATLSGVQYNQNETLEPSREFSHRGPALEEMVEISETPFAQQVRMPFGSLFGGRISISGFSMVTPTENIQRGLPGSGSLSGLSMGHAGIRAARDDNRYGLGLTLHSAGATGEALGTKLGRCVGRLIAGSFR